MVRVAARQAWMLHLQLSKCSFFQPVTLLYLAQTPGRLAAGALVVYLQHLEKFTWLFAIAAVCPVPVVHGITIDPQTSCVLSPGLFYPVEIHGMRGTFRRLFKITRGQLVKTALFCLSLHGNLGLPQKRDLCGTPQHTALTAWQNRSWFKPCVKQVRVCLLASLLPIFS